ncbi:nucleoside deaminase [Bradyrhizobium sp. B097]|uniref:nucleoside deaminase n=1 Tax=Bradyrhizobium sp. B097 TaxID=3140244 RepID=UPI003183CA9A
MMDAAGRPHGADDTDEAMMLHCIALARSARQRGELPYAAIISQRGQFVCGSPNMASTDRDVTHHAELVAISMAQKELGTVSLHECTLYSLVEPCPMCAYAVRETRIRRVVYGLRSPVMGGHTRWNILGDHALSIRMPEVFAAPPEIVAGYLQEEAVAAIRNWNSAFWWIIKGRGILTTTPADPDGRHMNGAAHSEMGFRLRMAAIFRPAIDRIWRS